jgi:hypothetical protein
MSLRLEDCAFLGSDNIAVFNDVARRLGLTHLHCGGHVGNLASACLSESGPALGTTVLLKSITSYVGFANDKIGNFLIAVGTGIGDFKFSDVRWTTHDDCTAVAVDHWDKLVVSVATQKYDIGTKT